MSCEETHTSAISQHNLFCFELRGIAWHRSGSNVGRMSETVIKKKVVQKGTKRTDNKGATKNKKMRDKK